MITISEKDGATIIVIENPSENEKKIIEQAKNNQVESPKKNVSNNVWAKFACNRNKKKDTQEPTTEAIPAKSDGMINLDDFVEIIGSSDIPF